MAGTTLQDLIKGCLLVILTLCPCVLTDFTLCEHNCTCHVVRLSSSNSGIKGQCTCPRFGIVPENIRQDILILELSFSEPVILKRGTIQKYHRIRSLNISGVQFVKPGGFQGLEPLRKLVLHNNFMRVLETAMFSDLGNLTHLKVEETTKNKIHALENGTFVGLTKLQHLVLKGNAIAVIAEEYFRDLQSLETLDMSNNSLTQIKANAFMNLPSLTQLTLSNNQITDIHRHAFIDLIKLKTLSLDGNQIRGMPQPMFGGMTNALYPRPTLDLDNNPLRCDCHLNWISSSVGVYHCDGSCLTPGEFKNKPVQKVYTEDGLPQCRPNNTVLSVQPGEQLKLTCPLAGASWRTPDGRHFQEHGDCQDLFCLTNSDSLVIWKTSHETSGNYTCSSSDGSQEYFYQVKDVNQPLTIAMGAGIAAGGFLVVVMSLVIGCKLRPKPPTVPIDANHAVDTHHPIDTPRTDQSLVEDYADGDDSGSLLRTDKYNIGAANFIDIFQKDSMSDIDKLNIKILKSNTL